MYSLSQQLVVQQKTLKNYSFRPLLAIFSPFLWPWLPNILLAAWLFTPQLTWSQVQNPAQNATQSPTQSQAATAPQNQNLRIINQKVKDFLTTQSAGSPGKVEITVNPMEEGTLLTYCPAPEAFFPPSSAAWGKTTVGVRCGQPKPWTVYVQANVSIIANYVVAGVPLSQGQVIEAKDLQLQKGDLTQLPTGVFTEFNRILGTSAKMSLPAGTVIKQEMLKLPNLVLQGQSVRVSSKGTGFSISTEGQALNSATEGEIVKVRVTNGSVVSGVVKKDGQIEVGGIRN